MSGRKKLITSALTRRRVAAGGTAALVLSPFIIRPKPVWFADHKSLGTMAKKLTAMEASPSWGKLVGVALQALRG